MSPTYFAVPTATGRCVGLRMSSVTGHAHVVRDVAKQKELWSSFAEAWLPQGPEAPDVGLIRVDPIAATYWDSPSGKIAQLWEIAKANVTQTRPDSDEVRKINLG